MADSSGEDYLDVAKRKFAKCRELASSRSGNPWNGPEERDRLRQQRAMHATEGLLAIMLARAEAD